MDRYEVKITYTATFEIEVEASTKGAALVLAGQDFEQSGIDESLIGNGVILIKRASAKKQGS